MEVRWPTGETKRFETGTFPLDRYLVIDYAKGLETESNRKMSSIRVILFVALCAIASAIGACSTADTPGEAPAADGGGPGGGDDGGPTGPDGGPGPSDAGKDATPSTDIKFKVQIDYRFDKAGFFSDPVRKQALEGACRTWGRLLSDSFANIPKDTFIRVRDPEKPTEPALSMNVEYEIDDLLVFVASSDLPGGTTGLSSPTAGLSGITDPTLATALDKRFNQQPFQPWTGWISFDTTTTFHFDPNPELGNVVPEGKIDFVSVALHELGHVLGFGTAAAFKSKISAGAFTGQKTQTLVGGPLTLSPDLAHVPNTTMSGGQRLLMDVSDATGTRYLPTPLDRAVFEDLGYHF